jgi:hypothetical protein
VAIVGRSVPLVQKGRQIKNSIAVYGGEQGQYLGRSIVNLDATLHAKTVESEMFILGPEVGEKKEVAALVQAFEDKFNEKLRKAEKEQAAKQQAQVAQNEPDHYLGDEICGRCHQDEVTQWKTTAHSHAWQTLVDKKKDAMPDCVPCHVVGFNKTGGFVNASATPKLTNVQCESCHGMGTGHDGFAANPAKISEATCITCHTSSNSPTFNFSIYEPHILHKFSGKLPPLPAKPAGAGMGGGN